MKRNVLKKIMMVLFLTINSIMGFAQEENVNNKMSGATHFFIKDRDAKNVSTPTIKLKDITPVSDLSAPEFVGKRLQPLYAKTDTIDGKAYISSFVRLDNENNTYAIEAKGAIVQCRFSNGLITALIPVDSIESVAAIADVKKVSVARRMSMMGNKARQATNTDDVLTQSTDAIAAGLSNKYDGSGVVLGVIDTGIDFNHIAFKDANGNSRIKTAYVYNGSSAKEYSGSSITSTLTDDNTEDHGTHTSSTAGGSSVIFSGSEGSSTWGSTVTVTTDHANATFGGMAPGADLYLAGINGLADTYIANAFQKICNYADGQGKPVVVSNSWGMSVGPRDGTGDIADVVNTYFGDSHPNHICLFAASNDAGNGGMYVSGSASSSSPLGTVIKSNYQDKYFVGVIADAWTRTSSSATMMCKVMTINKSTGAIVSTNTVTPTTSGASTGISGLYAIKQTSSSGHAGCYLYAYGSGSGYITSSYYIAVQFYPSSGSATVDVWSPGGYTYFDNSPSISGYTWQLGTDDSSVSDEATIKNSIAIGAYVTKNSLYDHNGTSQNLKSSYPNIGDIAYFSSYQVEGKGASQELLPWITAPGATIVAGVNHNHTSGDYSYMNDNMASYGMYRVNNNTSYPYGSMEGTSMATPVAAGIVALWLQAAQEVGREMTVNDIKTVMKETAINDSYTTGSNASHFGNGKIDALAGIKYILGVSGSPTIKVAPAEVSLKGYAHETYAATIVVTGLNLEADITASISGDQSFSIDKNRITLSAATDGAEITITWKPAAIGQTAAVLTLQSQGSDDVIINISGVAVEPELIVDPKTISLSCEAGLTASGEIGVLGADLKGDVTAMLDDPTGIFALSTTSITKAQAEDGFSIGITFAPVAVGTYTATVSLSAEDAEPVSVPIEATAIAPVPTLTASEQALSFSTDLTTTDTKIFTLTGRALTGDVNVELTDANQVFTVSPTNIAAADITDEGVAVTVSFQSPVEGTFQGSLTISSGDVDDICIALQATAFDGGTASDPFLNIAKYATIDEAGWNNTYVNTLYKYTTYEDNEVAWLTMPVYGAWVGCYYNDHPQKWISTDVTQTNNKYYGTSWNATDELLGSSPYFTGTSGAGAPRVMGFNSRTNATKETVSFYVTNTTAVKLLGLGQSRTSSQYPASLSVYECTKKTDGTLNVGSTAVKSSTNSATSGTFILTADDLDAQKIYKVEAATYRSYLAEIAFQTPLKKTIIGDVDRNGVADMADAKAIVDIILGKNTDEDNYDYEAADVNSDNDINIADVTALMNIILQK